ncbi:NAD(P)H-dependent oxidoreductase [Aliifodinibius sp. S!AR15-10]|uniref:NADPH-dependent FMN reductase n=1 Tax=Aliifodinibius sp. S!AR15-10 TaxID=2950437 RepID=UPI002863A7E4|nr:NAD(P)H-dependent oxidoreductase [Aliifodinibius sp. S!AR15-10]MDR8390039.1 NAD(P)H-dependent oxidoreductase [Aliifodinibius sp. S!AR15-10]
MYNLKVISSTTRPGRKGPIIAGWISEVAEQQDSFDVEMLDLGEIDLPMMNEPNHPRMKKYEHEHTKQWSAKIDEADAFIFVTAEYNHTYPASLQNALQYLSQEWNYKAAGIVSYGGVSAGTRAYIDLKRDLLTFKMAPLVEAVNIPFFPQFINNEDELIPNDEMKEAASTMLDELARWSAGMKVIKENKVVSA